MRVFITGASSGLGEGLALHYAREGAVVGLCARRAPLLAELSDRVRESGGQAHVYPADVSDTGEMQRVCAEFLRAAGGVDRVIANAGVGIAHGTLEGKSEPIAKLMQINVIGVTNTVVPFVPAMVEQGSGILAAVSSVAGHRGLPGRAAYSASKAAVITFMDALRLDLEGTGVHAMTLCPGFVHTPLTANLPGKLPFVISVAEAVAQMARAVEEHQKTFTFPWQVRVLSKLLKFAPEPLVRRMSPPARTQGTA